MWNLPFKGAPRGKPGGSGKISAGKSPFIERGGLLQHLGKAVLRVDLHHAAAAPAGPLSITVALPLGAAMA